MLNLAVVAGLAVACRQTGTAPPPVVVVANLDALDAQVRAHITEYISAAEENPQRAAAHSDLGLAYAGNKLWEAAAACFANASQLSRDEALPGYYHAIALGHLGKPRQALSRLRGTTLEFPDFAPAHHRLGVRLLYRGSVSEASAAFERVIALAPGAAEGYAGLGECLLLSEDYSKSIALLEKALQLNPRVRKTRYLLGRAYLKTGRQAKAQHHLTAGAGSQVRYMADPWSAQLQSHMKILADQIKNAAAYLESGNSAEGARILEAALHWHPDRVDVMSNLAACYLKMGRPEKARNLLLKAVEKDDTRFETYINLAMVHLDRGEANQSLESAEQAAALAPLSAGSHTARGRALLKLGRRGEARQAFRQALEYDPGKLPVRADLAKLCFGMRRYEEAREQYLAILRQVPDHFATQIWLCETAIRLGRLNEAGDVLEGARGLQPDHPDVVTLERRLRAQSGHD